MTHLLLRLILSHLIADFFLQPKKWIVSKREKRIKSVPLIIHAIIHGVLAYILIADWNNFWLPLILIIVHWGIDLLKVYQKSDFKWFIIDQLLHFISIVLLWGFFYGDLNQVWEYTTNLYNNKQIIWILIAYLFISIPTSMIINMATKNWQKELKDKNDSLNNAGKWIGILERILTSTFIFFNQFAAIGFLIAAKSIFRFGDLTNEKERKLTEYILIGTLLSFTITVIVGVIIKLQIS